jgi:hypothetical protein
MDWLCVDWNQTDWVTDCASGDSNRIGGTGAIRKPPRFAKTRR